MRICPAPGLFYPKNVPPTLARTSGNALGLTPRGWVTVLSLALNLALAAWLLKGFHPEKATTSLLLESGGSAATRNQPRGFHSTNANRAGARTPRTPVEPPFRWGQVESPDYREYVANLRAVGCPEPVIRDIVCADLRQLYAARMLATWPTNRLEYWQKTGPGHQITPERIEQAAAVEKEMRETMRSLLGTSVRGQEVIDMLFVQTHGPEQELAFLTEEQRGAAMRALDDAGHFDALEKRMLNGGSYSSEEEERLWHERLKLLEKVLTPEELKEYRLRNGRTSQLLLGELPHFDASEAEFGGLVEIRERLEADPKAPRDYYQRKQAETAAFKERFGEERGREFEQKTDLFYIWSRTGAEQYGLPETVATEAYQLKQDTLAEAARLRGDTSLGGDQLQERLAALQQQTEGRLNGLLGTNGARVARKGDGAWLNQLPQRLK